MINITLMTNAGRSTVFASENDTIREIFEANRVNYAVGCPMLDGAALRPGELDKTLAEIGITDTCYLSCMVKADNAAKVTIAGDAAVIVSDLKLDDIVLAQKYRPKALKLFEEKEQIFQIVAGKCPGGSINKYGVEFSENADAAGHATVTLPIEGGEGAKKYVQETYGQALLMLNKVEEGFAPYLEEIHADQAKIAEHITVL